MSQLKLYQPDEVHHGHRMLRIDDAEPPILSFQRHASRLRNRSSLQIVARARAMYENRRCPECTHPVVRPVELEDAAMNRSRLPIPGTATLVGFHCERCSAEWSV